MYNSTQPHGNEAAMAIIDYQLALEQVANATSLVADGERAVAMAVAAVSVIMFWCSACRCCLSKKVTLQYVML